MKAAFALVVLICSSLTMTGCFGGAHDFEIKIWNLSGRHVEFWLNITEGTSSGPLLASVHESIAADNASIWKVWNTTTPGIYVLHLRLANGTQHLSTESASSREGPEITYTFRPERMDYSKAIT
jgi:hypothetical protein